MTLEVHVFVRFFAIKCVRICPLNNATVVMTVAAALLCPIMAWQLLLFWIMAKKKFYAVAIGHNVGIYSTWAECETQVKGFPGTKFKSFHNHNDALDFIAPYLDKSSSSTSVASVTIKSETKASSTAAKRPATTLSNEDRVAEHAVEVVEEPIRKRRRISANRNDSLCFQISFDGGSRGNPGVAGAGAQVVRTIKTENNKTTVTTTTHSRRKTDIRYYLGVKFTNNQAEYQGLLCGLEYVLETLRQDYSRHGCPEVAIVVQGDSQLIIRQLNGNYACNSPKLRPLFQKAKKLVQDIKKHTTSQRLKISFEHVYRSNNTIADGMLLHWNLTRALAYP